MDNHDVERIYTKLNNKAHYAPVHVLLYTLPGVPSVYYGSEFGIEGKKEKFSDASLRPALSLDDYKNALKDNACTKLIWALGHIRQASKALSYGDYQQLLLTNRQYAFSRNTQDETAIITVNNDDSDYVMTVPCGSNTEFYGMLSGQNVSAVNGSICVNVKANSGEIWLTNAEKLFVADPAETDAASVPESETMCTEHDAAVKENAAESSQEAVQENAAESSHVAAGESGEAERSHAAAGENAEAKSSHAAAEENKAAGSAEDEAYGAVNRAIEDAFERGRIAGLQEAILAIMEKNGNVTDRMRQDVYDNVYHDSLINWVKSFR